MTTQKATDLVSLDHADKFVSDGSGMTTTQCMSCAHWLKGTWTCTAFPSSIPEVIRDNEFDHRHSFEGDEGIQFDPKLDVPADYLRRLYAALDKVDPNIPD